MKTFEQQINNRLSSDSWDGMMSHRVIQKRRFNTIKKSVISFAMIVILASTGAQFLTTDTGNAYTAFEKLSADSYNSVFSTYDYSMGFLDSDYGSYY